MYMYAKRSNSIQDYAIMLPGIQLIYCRTPKRNPKVLMLLVNALKWDLIEGTVPGILERFKLTNKGQIFVLVKTGRPVWGSEGFEKQI